MVIVGAVKDGRSWLRLGRGMGEGEGLGGGAGADFMTRGFGVGLELTA